MVPGMIMLWHGSVATIPSGWHLCDGNAGTINLTGRFILAQSVPKPPGTTGGSDRHGHDFTGDGHTHFIAAGTGMTSGPHKKDTTNSSTAVGTTDLGDNMPPWYALCYIQKL